MPQNIYDNPEFFAGYSRLRSQSINANNVLVRPNMQALVGNPAGLDVLDLGCGTGSFYPQLQQHYPAAQYIGLDLIHFKR